MVGFPLSVRKAWPVTVIGIEMTAPVQMELVKKTDEELSQASMAFLYGSPQLGEPGDAGSVRVVDADPMKVVSLGIRGSRRKQFVTDAVRRLNRWLQATPKYQAAGGFRVMGYNSPFVPRGKQFFEVQLPVRESSIEASKPVPVPEP